MNPSTRNCRRNLWPHAIMAWFIIFGTAMAVWIVVAVRQKMDLVRTDYYEEELRFEQQLGRLNRTAALRNVISVNYDAARREVILVLSATHLGSKPAGQIDFYRPSNASLDFQVPLAVDAAGLQRIDADTLHGGLWRVRVRWSAAGQDCFFEQAIVIDEAGTRNHGRAG